MKDHELFPASEEKAAPDVVKIMVKRVENGVPVAWPFGFVPAEEIPDLATLYGKCGGGRYELVARDAKKIVALMTYTIAGDPKPLDGSTPRVEMPAAQAPAASRAGGTNVLEIVAAVSPLVLGLLQHSAAQSQQQMAMFTSLLTASAGNADKHVQAMTQLYQANTAQLTQMFAQLRPGGADGENGLIKGVELATEFFQGHLERMQGGGGGEGLDAEGLVDAAAKALDTIERVKRFAEQEKNTPPMPKKVGQRPVPVQQTPPPATDEDDDGPSLPDDEIPFGGES